MMLLLYNIESMHLKIQCPRGDHISLLLDAQLVTIIIFYNNLTVFGILADFCTKNEFV